MADHYIDPETGFLVMTAEYHLARGYCCKNGCRHCPYPVLGSAETKIQGGNDMSDQLLGKTLPILELENSAGGTVHLPKDILGKWTLFYFYPKDDTPGCTKQACAYRDSYAEFRRLGINLFGVSMDDLHSHDSFIQKFNLNFPLLADTQKKLSEALGVYGEQEWKGQKYFGLSRDTFLVDPKGIIKEVWRKVNAETTAADTLTAIKKYL